MKMKVTAVFFTLLLLSFGAAAAGERKCLCVANGTSYEEGQVVCLRLGSAPYTARCERFLNNTTWTKVHDGCDAMSMLVPIDSEQESPSELAGLSHIPPD